MYNNHVLTCYRHRIQSSGTNDCNSDVSDAEITRFADADAHANIKAWKSADANADANIRARRFADANADANIWNIISTTSY